MDDFLAIIEGRTGTRVPWWSYKVAPGMYALDAEPDADAEPRFDDGEMCVTVPFASGVRRDREGDLLEIEGIQTDNHRANPQAMLDHGKYWPLGIGLCESPGKQYGVRCFPDLKTAESDVYFAQHGPSARLAEQLYHAWRTKQLRTGSIGYDIRRARKLPPDHEKGIPKGLHLIETELLEVSITALPANADCCASMLDKGYRIQGKSLLEPIRHGLSQWAPEKTSTTVGFADVIPEGETMPEPITNKGKAKGAKAVPDEPIRVTGDVTGPKVTDREGAADVSNESMDKYKHMPHGAALMKAHHDNLAYSASDLEDGLKRMDSCATKDHMAGHLAALQEHMKAMCDHYKSEYPDEEPLPDVPGEDGQVQDPGETHSEEDTQEAEGQGEWRKKRKAFQGRVKTFKAQYGKALGAAHLAAIEDVNGTLADIAQSLPTAHKLALEHCMKSLDGIKERALSDAETSASLTEQEWERMSPTERLEATRIMNRLEGKKRTLLATRRRLG